MQSRKKEKNEQKEVPTVNKGNVDASSYSGYLAEIEKSMGSGMTYNDTLEKKGKSLFGPLFLGVYPKDKIPGLISRQSCIFNLDTSGQKGSHWCAMYKQGSRRYVYDSFGRQVLGSGTSYTDPDAEQTDAEKNCGQRCIAWLLTVYLNGLSEALKV